MEINIETIKNLTDPCKEVRLRALIQIDAKLQRALAVNESLQFNVGALCKQVYRWFNTNPLQTLEKPLKLLRLLLSSKYGPSAVKHIGLSRMQRENKKVREVLNSCKCTEGLEILADIEQLLKNYEKEQEHREETQCEQIIKQMRNICISEEEKKLNNVISTESCCTTPNTAASNMSVAPGDTNAINSSITICQADYEAPWSKVCTSDFNVMKLIAEELANPNITAFKLENTLNHMQINMPDYPAEYFLQAPHIFLNVLKLDERARNLAYPHNMLIESLLAYLKQLKQRLEARCNILLYATPASDLQFIGATQLKVEKVVELVIDQSLDQLNEQLLDQWHEEIMRVEMIVLALRIYKIQRLVVPEMHIHKLSRMCEQLKIVIENSANFTLQRLKYLLLSALLLHILEQNAELQLPQKHNSPLLESLLRDYSLKLYFPHHYARLSEFLFVENIRLKDQCSALRHIDDAIHTALNLLVNSDNFKKHEMITLGLNFHFILDQIESIKLAKTLFDAIVQCKVEYLENARLKEDAMKLLHLLLNLKNVNIRTEIYRCMVKTVKFHIMLLASGERICRGIDNADLFAKHIIGVPLNCEILLCAIVEYNTNPTLSADLQDMLLSLLQIHHMLGVHWRTLQEILLPLLPYMHCLTEATQLIDQLQSCYDPDATILDFPAMLQGNIRFLFHANAQLRHESLTRILYMIGTMQDSRKYVPNTRCINPTLLSDICVIEPPREIARIFIVSESLQHDIGEVLDGLYTILDSPDVEPLIRKSALLQLQTLSQDWQVARRMIADSAECLVLLALNTALMRESQGVYQENCKPTVSILARLLLCDVQLRMKLKDDVFFQVLLLRTMFLYQHDLQLRQDASLCLFQLVFPMNYIIHPPTHTTSAIVHATSMLSALKTPIKFTWTAPQADLPPIVANEIQFAEVFKDEHERTLYFRHLINFKLGTTTKSYDICDALKVTAWDHSLMKATCPERCLRRCLRAFDNATDNKKVIDVAAMLELQLYLINFLNEQEQVSDESMLQLFKIINRVLQAMPTCEQDFQCFEQVLQLSSICVRSGRMQFIKAFTEALQSDPHHSMFRLLQNTETPVRLYSKLSQLLTKLAKLQNNAAYATPMAVETFNERLFSSAMESAKLLFQQRDLLRLRCLLLQLQQLAALKLSYKDTVLMTYFEYILRLSVSLKTYTQTGAQWHRCCLLLLERLSRKLMDKQLIIKSINPLIKFISGLCSHSDAAVRHLAWILLITFAECNEQPDSNPNESSENVGAKLLVAGLEYLPGGLLACCLSTLFDSNEVIAVRSCAGSLFAKLISNSCTDNEFVMKLLERHAYFENAHNALQYFTSSERLPLDQQPECINPDIVRCFCCIASILIERQPSIVEELCQKSFLLHVYELLKRPVVVISNCYYKMAADICYLYAQCKKNHFILLQRTICRDQLWLHNFFLLIEQSQHFESQEALAKFLQILLVLCVDEIACISLWEKFAHAPHVLVGIFLRSFEVKNMNTLIQTLGLNALSILLIISRSEALKEQLSLVEVLESIIEINYNEELQTDENCIRENDINAANNVAALDDAQVTDKSRNQRNVSTIQKASGSEFIFQSLYRIWNLLYPVKSYRFESPPSENQKMVNRTLGQLLQDSPQAQVAAEQVCLLEKILGILKRFFDELNMSSETFIRRYGDRRKTAVFGNIQELLMIVFRWQNSVNGMCINNKSQAYKFSTLMDCIWTWSHQSVDLKLLLLRVCARATERSMFVCEKFACAGNSSLTCMVKYPSSATSTREPANSMLGWIIKFIWNESMKVRSPSTNNMPIIEAGMHIIMNCCVCPDGRKLIAKKNLHDIFGTLAQNKNLVQRSDILLLWLKFWEVFTSHKDSQQVRCLDVFASYIEIFPPGSEVRLCCLNIFHNYCKSPSNFACILNSNQFFCATDKILSENLIEPDESKSEAETIDLQEELIIVTVFVWRLLAYSVKHVALLRGTKLAKKFQMLRDQILHLKATDPIKFERLPQAEALERNLGIVMNFLEKT